MWVDSNGRLVFGTGHIPGAEELLVAREARKVGLQVTSPHGITGMNAAQLQEIREAGGFLELRQNGPRAEAVRNVGAESIIVSTDCGFTTNPFPPDCFAIMAKQLRAQGITERELDLMFKENPAKLLGLPPWREVAAASTAIHR
jgi:predicted TIM-barrel fold metal-dependent hydrolase